ncbi:TPA: hypothetical protein ACXN3T_001409 [Proteus mirabilis]
MAIKLRLVTKQDVQHLHKMGNESYRYHWLEVLAENHKAITFYKANGMEIIKEFTFKSATQQSTEFIMTKLV